jgi:hypothetical protein
MVKKIALMLGCILTVICFAGCGYGIYSRQDYGPARATVGTGTSVAELVQTFGAPNIILKSGDSELYVYRVVVGKHVVLFGDVKKSDFVVTVKRGKVTGSSWVRTGEAQHILAIQGPVYETE